MSSEASSTPDQAAEDAQLYRACLHGLMDMATNLARAVHDRAMEQAEPPTPEQALTFDRLARAVRRTILLARHVATPLPAHATVPGLQRAAARKRILRGVEDAIERAAEGDDAEAMQAELLERLDAPDLEDEIAGRPVPDIVADICRDLGLYNEAGFTPYKRRTPDDIQRLCARAAAPAASLPPQRAASLGPAAATLIELRPPRQRR